jgi:hypothetical protein
LVGVAGEHREADRLATRIDDAVVVRRGIVRQRHVEELVLLAVRIEQRSSDLRHVLGVPRQRHLLALLGGVRGLLQRLAAMEIMVELDERAVTQLHGLR